MAESPREAIEATLGLIVQELTGQGFALKSGLVLRRKIGDFGHVFRCQSSKWNLGGEFAEFQLSAWFESDQLSSWMKKRWPGRPAAITQFDRVVSAKNLMFPDSPHQAKWDVVDPAVRPEIAREAASVIRCQALPWFEEMSDPAIALSELGTTPTFRASIVHYAVATGYSDAARERIASLAESSPQFAAVLGAVRLKGKPSAYRNTYEPIAWAAVECGIA